MQLTATVHIEDAHVGIFADDAPDMPLFSGALQILRILFFLRLDAGRFLRRNYPKEPRPSFADQVLNLLHDRGTHPVQVLEMRELQAVLGLVAAEVGLCLIPAAARFRNDLVYLPVNDEHATSPVILSHRTNDSSWYIEATLRLLKELYAENPPWLMANK